MQTGSSSKNPPWARSNVNTNITGMNPQIMDPNSMIAQQGMMQFQQTQVFNPGMMQAQGGMAMPMTGQMPMNQMSQGQMYPGNVVAYPTPRALNSALYQNQTNQPTANNEQRVFTGTVTKTHNDFGFVDHDVFYQTSVCSKGIIPKVNDRVLVEANYNANMPFKWNATRVQVLPKNGGGPPPKQNSQKSSSYNAVPPPLNRKSQPPRRDDRPPRREDRKRSRTRSRSRSKERRDNRARRDSPPRKRTVHAPSPVKYVVRVPRMPLDIDKMDVPTVSQRYNNLYIPSDFFNAYVKWGDAFPPEAPLSLNKPCGYHIMSKEADNPIPNDAVLEPPDADYRFSAKVMLISMPTLESLYQKCGLTKVDDKDKRSKTPLHPTRLIKFLVGQKGKGGENFAIGGPWSPSLDGENPQSDPSVLVKTAIRTCKALTGIDLSSCTQWYRMVEFYYWREGSGGKSRLECVVLFLPDVWSAQPSRVDWGAVIERYKGACERAVAAYDSPHSPHSPHPACAPSPATSKDTSSQIEDKSVDDTTIVIDENEDESRPEATHYSKLDLKSMKVHQLQQELRARKVSVQGHRAQLLSRLSKLLKAEEGKESQQDEIMEVKDDQEQFKDNLQEHIDISDDTDDQNDLKIEEQETGEKKEVKKETVEKTEKEIEEDKKKAEKEKQLIRNRYEMPSSPHLIVHPSATAKGGKFACTVATLSLLLDYRITDNKEHSFELFVFAELFNEMLMRDFGFYIYKTLYTLPEKKEEEKETKEKSVEKRETGEKAEKVGEKAEKKDDKNGDKKDDKREDKREPSRRRERKESHSDEERSAGGGGGGGSKGRGGRGVAVPADPYLLLALVYFDTARGGHVSRKDLHALFMALGLHLTRSQVRALLDRVCVKDDFNYKGLMQAIKELAAGTSELIQDLPLDTVAPKELPPTISELESTIAAGNRDLLPLFKSNTEEDDSTSTETKDISETGMVVYKSRVVDVGALVRSAAREATARSRLEAALEKARAALRAARAAAASTQRAERGAQSQLSDLSASLAAAHARIASLTASSKIFHSALKSIQSKVEAVVNIKYEDDDVVEIVNGPANVEKKEKKEENSEIRNETVDISEDIKEEDDVDADDNVESVSIPDEEADVAIENMDLDDAIVV